MENIKIELMREKEFNDEFDTESPYPLPQEDYENELILKIQELLGEYLYIKRVDYLVEILDTYNELLKIKNYSFGDIEKMRSILLEKKGNLSSNYFCINLGEKK